jgi:S-ribosylhomocysteine lyase
VWYNGKKERGNMPIVQDNDPTVESFLVNHTKMKAPLVREAKIMETPSGDVITVFDLRFKTPNQEKMPWDGAHTMEHLLAGLIRKHLDYKVIDVSGMFCFTGFYLSVIGRPSLEEVKIAWDKSMRDIRDYDGEIGEANIFQCGSYKDHSLAEAKEIAISILERGISEIDNKSILLTEAELEVINQMS